MSRKETRTLVGESGVVYKVTTITHNRKEYIYYEINSIEDYLYAIVMSVDLKKPLFIVDLTNDPSNDASELRDYVIKSGGIVVRKQVRGSS